MLAAKHAAVDPEIRGWRRVLAAERECSFTPFLLAARSNGELSDAARKGFERHLDACVTCQGAELRFARAERAFDGVLLLEAVRDAVAAAACAGDGAVSTSAQASVAAAPSTDPPQPARVRWSGLRGASFVAGAMVAAGLAARRAASDGRLSARDPLEPNQEPPTGDSRGRD